MGLPAARLTDNHMCPMVTPGLPPIPHVGGPIIGPCVPNVLIGSMPAATLGDMCICVGPPDSIIKGSASVLIGGKPAARMFDNCAHGGMIVVGCPTVLIGDAASPASVSGMQASASGAKFCDICNLLSPQDDKPASPANQSLAAPQSGPGSQKLPNPTSKAGEKAAAKAPAKKDGPLENEKVKELVDKSPTLQNNIKKLEEQGWTIKYGESGKGSFCNREANEIVLDPDHKDPGYVVQTLAHESGHALYKPDPYVDFKGLTKDDYVAQNVKRNLKDEGEATLMNAEIRQEIIDNKGEDIGIAGSQSEKYKKAYENYKKNPDREKARNDIGDIFADNEVPSTDVNSTYRKYYAKTFEEHFDKYGPKP